MKLYYFPGACSIAPHIVAREAGIALELEKVDLGSKRTATGEDYLAVNPKGYVPALRLDDGSVLTEVSALVQYLADRAPGSGLIPPAGSMERYRVLEWIGYISTEIHKGFGPLWNAKLAPEARAAAVAALAHRLDLVEKSLASQPFLTGERFTVADAYLFAVASWAPWVKLDMAPWPKVRDFVARVGARPKVQEALVAEGLVE
ncbi:MAG: glutathione transferase GstA [Lysobacter sp.]|nr:glutathione transferase GstA [Lysobacter sp.]